MALVCAECATQNAADARFCNACGAALARACPVCGAEQPAVAAFGSWRRPAG